MKMTKRHLSTFILMLLAAGLTGRLHAEINRTINYQGFLLDKATLLPINTPQDMEFALCNDATNPCTLATGGQLFVEQRCNVEVVKGRYHVEIGSMTGAHISSTVFVNNPNVWLERRVDAENDCNGVFEAMQPRMRVQAAGYAFHALHADTATITTDIATGTFNHPYSFTNQNSTYTGTQFKVGVFELTQLGIDPLSITLENSPKPFHVLLPDSAGGVKGSSITLKSGIGNSGGGVDVSLRGGDIQLLAGDGSSSPGGNILIRGGNTPVDATSASSSTIIIGGTPTGVNNTGALIRVHSGPSQGAGNNIPGGDLVLTAGSGAGTGNGGHVILNPGIGTAKGSFVIGTTSIPTDVFSYFVRGITESYSAGDFLPKALLSVYNDDINSGNNHATLRLESRPTSGNPAEVSLSAVNTGAGSADFVINTRFADTRGERLRVEANGHLRTSGPTQLTLSNCGTSPSVTGTDVAGKITVGGGTQTQCDATFVTSYGNPPACVVTGEDSSLVYVATTSITMMVITSNANISGDKISYICIGL